MKIDLRIATGEKLTREKEVERLVKTVMSGQRYLHDLEQLKFTRYYDNDMRKKVNIVVSRLKRKEEVFEHFLDTKETTAEQVHDLVFDFIEMNSKIKIEDMQNLIRLKKAYDKDKKSLNGIANKILK